MLTDILVLWRMRGSAATNPLTLPSPRGGEGKWGVAPTFSLSPQLAGLSGESHA